ncbi:MAG: hypothetical protein ABGZ53_06455 [Fuerstiella sp.]
MSEEKPETKPLTIHITAEERAIFVEAKASMGLQRFGLGPWITKIATEEAARLLGNAPTELEVVVEHLEDHITVAIEDAMKEMQGKIHDVEERVGLRDPDHGHD